MWLFHEVIFGAWRRSGIRIIGPGDVMDDDLIDDMGDAALGTVTAHERSRLRAEAIRGLRTRLDVAVTESDLSQWICALRSRIVEQPA